MRRTVILSMAMLGLMAISARGADDAEPTIANLLKDGWQIAGFTAPGDNRSSFILFRHPERFYLVNCRVGYDVTGKERRYANGYKVQ